jgi:acyl-CoA thioesterase
MVRQAHHERKRTVNFCKAPNYVNGKFRHIINNTREKMKNFKNFLSINDHFARHSGIELVEVESGRARASMHIEPYHRNAAGTVHGGAIFTLADFAFAAASNSHGTLAMGINTSVSFVKAAIKGTLYAEAKEQVCGPKLASYQVMVTDDDNAVVAIFQGMVYRKKETLQMGGS